MAGTSLEDDRDQGNDDWQSPGHSFASTFEAMHTLVDKLTTLEYAKFFCPEYKCKPLHRYYFAVQSNPGEQFYTFSCLCAWLIKSKCKLPIEAGSLNPQDYEDPNVTIHSILEGLRLAASSKGNGSGSEKEEASSRSSGSASSSSLNIVDFPPGKLKQGFGVEVLQVLLALADCALKLDAHQPATNSSTIIVVKGLSETSEDEEMASNEDNELEINFEEQYTLIDEEAPEGGGSGGMEQSEPRTVQSSSYQFDGHNQQQQSNAGRVSASLDKPKEILVSTTTDSAAWASEVERVLPRLKVVLRASDHKADWRAHVVEMQRHKREIDESFSGTRASLEKLTAEVSRSLEKIASREKYLQLQLEPLVNEYSSLKGQLGLVGDKYRVLSGGVTEKSRQLSDLNELLDAVKSEMDERGSSMTDGTPLISLRKALGKMKAELVSIDIRIGVATQTILHANLEESNAQQALQRGNLESPIKMAKSSLQRLVF